MSEVEIKIKLTGYGRLVVGRLCTLLEDYLTESEDPEVNPPNAGQRSVELEVEIAGDDRIRVSKKDKKVLGSHDAMINSISERAHALLAFYFPFDDEDDDDPITLTLKVIMQPFPVTTDAPARTYVVSYAAIVECVSLSKFLKQEINEKVDDY